MNSPDEQERLKTLTSQKMADGQQAHSQAQRGMESDSNEATPEGSHSKEMQCQGTPSEAVDMPQTSDSVTEIPGALARISGAFQARANARKRLREQRQKDMFNGKITGEPSAEWEVLERTRGDGLVTALQDEYVAPLSDK